MIEDPGPMPTPLAEQPQLYPGGADAIVDPGTPAVTLGGPVGADMPPQDHPAGEATPDEVTEPDDKQQEPAAGGDEIDAEHDDSEPEPPA